MQETFKNNRTAKESDIDLNEYVFRKIYEECLILKP